MTLLLLLKPALFIIHTEINFVLFSKFLPTHGKRVVSKN